MRRFWTILKLMVIMNFRNPVALFFSILLPTASLLLFGSIFNGNSVPIGGGAGTTKYSYAVWLLPGIIVTNIMATGLMGNSSTMIAWRERDIFRRIMVTPTGVWLVMLARVLTQVVTICVQAVIAIVIGTAIFNYQFDFSYLPLTLVFLILGAVVFLGFGQLIASLTSRVEVGSVISQIFYIALSFLTGVMLPLSLLPSFAGTIAKLTPSYMVVNLLRSAMLQGEAGSSALLYIVGLLAYFAAAITLSAYTFKMLAK